MNGSAKRPQVSIDRALRAQQARWTRSFSPSSLTLAYLDWLTHLLNSPGKIGELGENAASKSARFALWAARRSLGEECPDIIEPLPQDRRFRNDAWKRWPFDVMWQGFLMWEQWWHYATIGLPGVSLHHEDLVSFAARQLLDVCSPSNFLWTNPEVIEATVRERGANLQRGALNFVDDVQDQLDGWRKEQTARFKVGKDVAVTPGKVVFRNRLIELIQYSPATRTVFREPVLIVPAWIMKYYILDLSPHNSLVKYLVEKGYTVFMISWRNPGPEDRDLSMEDYLNLGVMSAMDAVEAVCPGRGIHGVGYCIGGTLITIAAAAMARDGDTRLESLSLFASLMDFTEAGELKVFVDESQLSFLEDVMWDRGYLDNREMAGAFQLLRSNDLVWSRMVRDYLLGERRELNDLMAWNLDSTRMPYHMHAEYLRKLYLHNDLASGRYRVNGRPIAVSDIRVPVFMVGTVTDHVVPWRSVYKAHLLLDTEITFALTTGGHNAGIVSEPGHPGRRFQIYTVSETDQYIDPQAWLARAPEKEGSWWPAWHDWLRKRSERKVRPPAMGSPRAGYPPVGDAPGEYALMP